MSICQSVQFVLSLCLMQQYNSNLVLAVLRKEYPEIAIQIDNKIRESLPDQRLTDLSNIEKIVSSFKRERSVIEESWTNCKGKANITHERDLLIAVTLLFYDPDKLMQLIRKHTQQGVLKQVSDLIGTSQKILSMTTPNVIVAFKAYPDFRAEVYRLYELISNEHKFFE